jgi:hypothetical protein
MSRRAWARVATGSAMAACVALTGFGITHGQMLLSVRVGIVGTMDSAPTRPTTVAVALPPGFGLTASEQRAGLPALNAAQQQQTPLCQRFTVALAKAVRICTTAAIWEDDVPPPRVSLALTLSDAPGETYLAWWTKSEAGYLVFRGGAEVQHSDAAWLISVGDLERAAPDGGQVPLYLLHVRFTRQLGTVAATNPV